MIPLGRLLPFAVAIAAAITATTAAPQDPHPSCKYIPGDRGWPGDAAWARLNATVNGRLIPTVPLAHVCHSSGVAAEYDQAACADLGRALVDNGAQILQPRPGEVMNPYFQNLTCSPFTPATQPCELGERASYSINVTGASDVQAGLRFAREHNVRLVIRSTGIDYMGKSTGKGSLALWMFHLKSIDIIQEYRSSSFSGPAVRLGSGVIAGEAYEVVSAAGYRIVAPECGLSGIVGGYLQGGGHSQLTTAYGMGADQVLEWELVTPKGECLIATPERHSDLYWALAGGGGGTYGVVLSATVAAYPDGPVAGGSMVFENTNETAYWEAVGIWYSLGPSFVRDGPNNVQFLVTNASLSVFAITLPGQSASAIESLLAPFLPELEKRGLPYNLSLADHAVYVDSLDAAYGDLPYGSLCPEYPVISSRLIPRATVLNETSNARLMEVFREITTDGTWFVGCSFIDAADHGHDDDDSDDGGCDGGCDGGDDENEDDDGGCCSLSPKIRPQHPPNAVHPAWRSAIAYCNPNRPWDWRDPEGSLAAKDRLVSEYFPAMEAATPGSGVYLNEMDPLYRGDWKGTMYGDNYERLLRIKHTHDPDALLYAHFAVGSDEFTIDDEGRLCRVEAAMP